MRRCIKPRPSVGFSSVYNFPDKCRSYVTTVTMRRFFLLLGSRRCINPNTGMETMWQQTVRITIAGVMVWTVSVLAFAVAG